MGDQIEFLPIHVLRERLHAGQDSTLHADGVRGSGQDHAAKGIQTYSGGLREAIHGGGQAGKDGRLLLGQV